MMSDEKLPAANRVRVMGILNVTPDSFSDGGSFICESDIRAQVLAMVEARADFIDVGGESSRPFADPVAAAEELQRVLPAIEIIRSITSIPISIDTCKAEVARRALAAGADIINDISALRFDPEMISVVRETEAPVVIMHMQGTPRDMQINPHYNDVVTEIISFFDERIAWAEAQGVDRSRFIIDPGIGFGKTLEHNLTILSRLREFAGVDLPLLVGHSRKAFIGAVLGIEKPSDRDEATAVISALIANRGASIIRVHDVKGTVQALRLAASIRALA